MKRGQIYYIRTKNTLGVTDTKNGRPGIIVSNNATIDKLDTILVVPLTTHEHEDLPTHATVNATGNPSVALCERVYWAGKSHIGDYCGTCSDAEMERIETALMVALGLDFDIVEDNEVEDEDEDEEDYGTADYMTDEGVDLDALLDELGELSADLAHACGERDAYKAIVDKLLGGNTDEN